MVSATICAAKTLLTSEILILLTVEKGKFRADETKR